MKRSSKSIISRIAPTPSGYLHFGNAFNFLLTALIVYSKGGHLHLRIDDMDGQRVQPSSVEDIFLQLEWLGIEYDSGPIGPDDLFKNHSQRLRREKYLDTIELFRNEGKLFACECSRSEIRRFSKSNNYPGTCRQKNLDFIKRNRPWRFLVPEQSEVTFKTFANKYESINVAKEMGDFIIKRRDGLPGYQIISVMEDIELGVNLVVRGDDLLNSTATQIFLAQSLNDSVFPAAKFLHHKLINDKFSKKLSKSNGSLSLKKIRERYPSAVFIYRQVGKLLNLPYQQINTLEDLKTIYSETIKRRDEFKSFIS